MCAHLWEYTCVRLTRCWFPQLWSNSAVTQSPCERRSASALPPTSTPFVCVCMCVWQPLPLLVPQAPRRSGSPGLVYYVSPGSRQQQPRSHAPMHPVRTPSWHLIPDIQQLQERGNSRKEESRESREARWVGGIGFRDIFRAGTVGRREETRECVMVCVWVCWWRFTDREEIKTDVEECGRVCVRGTKACFTELNNRSPWKNAC